MLRHTGIELLPMAALVKRAEWRLWPAGSMIRERALRVVLVIVGLSSMAEVYYVAKEGCESTSGAGVLPSRPMNSPW